MFIPPAFAEQDLARLHLFLIQNSFGLVVSQVDGAPFATHLPLLLQPAEGPLGTLTGHFARANPQWRQLVGQTVLVIFTGPHAYISPTWYEAENTVPTWNYTAVHVYGQIELVESGEPLLNILKETVQTYEQSKPQPWTLEGNEAITERLIEQIVGFRMVIEKIEGKFKLNQNHPAERRQKVIKALEEQGDENSLGLANLMRETP
ncbi:FMN-binding negative transcriptional regulator [Lignipirellula cremea]|uniref:Protease synthase and sporulation protein PAI 2 n=1 Tax=Lignipirellula cremea TaxID=2528010 RepID=A0A518DY28_9BACT|nr:FMN-binding negative transcriptional regulator [Lignipirellula cremea]QDU96750.1 Protease synthase and sporulation protein PAI 2 [Lignipirellula cremea]